MKCLNPECENDLTGKQTKYCGVKCRMTVVRAQKTSQDDSQATNSTLDVQTHSINTLPVIDHTVPEHEIVVDTVTVSTDEAKDQNENITEVSISEDEILEKKGRITTEESPEIKRTLTDDILDMLPDQVVRPECQPSGSTANMTGIELNGALNSGLGSDRPYYAEWIYRLLTCTLAQLEADGVLVPAWRCDAGPEPVCDVE